MLCMLHHHAIVAVRSRKFGVAALPACLLQTCTYALTRSVRYTDHTQRWQLACRGDGLYEGLDWLSNTLKQLRRQGVATSVQAANR